MKRIEPERHGSSTDGVPQQARMGQGAVVRRNSPQRWAIIGSVITVQVPSMHRILLGRVCEIEGEVLAVETEVGVIRVQRIHCHPRPAARREPSSMPSD